MARLESLLIDGGTLHGTLTERFRDLVGRLNDRLQSIRGAINANEGSPVRWTETVLPTASVEFAGRLLYHDRGQGATTDKLYVCLWNGATWAWVLLA